MKLTTLQGLQNKSMYLQKCRYVGFFYYQKLLFTEKTNILEKVTQMSQNSFEKYLFFLKNSIEKVTKKGNILYTKELSLKI